MTASKFRLLAAGIFFLGGLISGVWKFVYIMTSPTGKAPAYVDVTHRAGLMYAFSCLLFMSFVPYSPLPPLGTLWAVMVPILFFASAMLTYALHGLLRDTDNQLRRPFRLGTRAVPGALIWTYMIALMIGEIGGFAVLLYGAFRT